MLTSYLQKISIMAAVGNMDIDRQKLIQMAVQFLRSPAVATSSIDVIKAFLQKKGLDETEILSAFDLSGFNNTLASHSLSPPMVQNTSQIYSRFSVVRDCCNILIIVGGAVIGIHYLYKQYIEPYLTGHRKKTVEESVIEVQQSVVSVLQQVQVTMSSLETTLHNHTIQLKELQEMKSDRNNEKLIDELRGDITSIKSLMLNRRSFPSSPTPSIPSWQRTSNDSLQVPENSSTLKETKPTNHLPNGIVDIEEKTAVSEKPAELKNGAQSNSSDTIINRHNGNKTEEDASITSQSVDDGVEVE